MSKNRAKSVSASPKPRYFKTCNDNRCCIIGKTSSSCHVGVVEPVYNIVRQSVKWSIALPIVLAHSNMNDFTYSFAQWHCGYIRKQSNVKMSKLTKWLRLWLLWTEAKITANTNWFAQTEKIKQSSIFLWVFNNVKVMGSDCYEKAKNHLHQQPTLTFSHLHLGNLEAS